MDKRIIAVIALLALQASLGHELEFSRSSLPLVHGFGLQINGTANTTLDATYGEYLAGPSSISFNTSEFVLRLELSLAQDAESFDTWVSLSDGRSIAVAVSINDDLPLVLTPPMHCFTGQACVVMYEAHPDSTLAANVTGPAGSVASQVTDRILFVPDRQGRYDISVSMSYNNFTRESHTNLSAYSPLACSISAKSPALINESVSFTPAVQGGIGRKAYRWELGDGTGSEISSPVHAYAMAGSFNARLTVIDEANYRSTCSATVIVDAKRHQVIVQVMDNETGLPVGDANVTLGTILAKSNVNGRAVFTDIEDGSYPLHVARNGYLVHSSTQRISGDATIAVNLSEVPEELLPVPKIELISPASGISLVSDSVAVEFRVRSDSPVESCRLLAQESGLLGYRVLATKADVQTSTTHTFKLELPNGRFRWKILCDNIYGDGLSEDRDVEVSGFAAPLQPEVQQAEAAEQLTSVGPEIEAVDAMLAGIQSIRKDIIARDADTREVYGIIGFANHMDVHEKRLRELRQEFRDLPGLSITQADRDRKMAKLRAELDQIKAELPKSMNVMEKAYYEPVLTEQDIQQAAHEYLAWRGHNLTAKQLSRFLDRLETAQAGLSVAVKARILEVQFQDMKTGYYSILTKEPHVGEVDGYMLFEVIPKTVAESIEHLIFTQNFELVNRDPVVSMYLEEPEYSYYVKKRVSLDELKQASTVLMLDITHPKNSITGLAILDLDAGSGKLLLLVILLGAVLVGNYAIFFREPRTRQQMLSAIRTITLNLRPMSKRDRLLSRLDTVIDMLNAERSEEAISHYDSVFALYAASDPVLRHELMPVMEHLRYELELYSLNSIIAEAYERVSDGLWSQATELHSTIHEAASKLPARYRQKASARMKKLNLAMEIHRLRSGSGSVEDAIFGK